MTDDEFVDFDCLYAAEKEPLLGGHPGNARRRASLERIRDGLMSKKGEDHSRLLELVGCVEPDSAPGAWARLFHRLEGVDSTLASIAASEHALARSDTWGAMRTGADMIPHLNPICVSFDERRHGALGSMRDELYVALSYIGKSLEMGPEMQDYVVNFARFGSRADDEMTGLLVKELYIRRDLLEEACDICEEILKFDGVDRDRMRASTLVEDILTMVLGGLEDRNRKHRSLADRCASMLEGRSDDLGLGIRPNPDDHNVLRALSEFALNISVRRRICTAKELGPHIEANYPMSHKFLQLDRISNLERMVKGRSPLAANMSVSIDSRKIAAVRKIPYTGGNALMLLEPMLAELEKTDVCPGAMKKWRGGLRGNQLWEYLFEMEMYLRIFMTGTKVEADKKIGTKEGGKNPGKTRAKGKPGKKSGQKEVDLEFNGCCAEIYSPLESEVLVPRHVVTVEDPGTHFVGQVLSKGQLGDVGERETMMIVECPVGMYANVEMLGKKMAALMEKSGQPGGVFFVRADSSSRRTYEYLANPGAVTPVSGTAIKTVRKALELEFPPAGQG